MPAIHGTHADRPVLIDFSAVRTGLRRIPPSTVATRRNRKRSRSLFRRYPPMMPVNYRTAHERQQWESGSAASRSTGQGPVRAVLNGGLVDQADFAAAPPHGGSEPNVSDAAHRTNCCNLHKPVIDWSLGGGPSQRSLISAVANKKRTHSPKRPFTV